ncbi:MAG: hypothetical protein ABIR58_01565 [Gemmatimonadaceae bacterium]
MVTGLLNARRRRGSSRIVNVVREGNGIRIWSGYQQALRPPFDWQYNVRLRPSVERSF